VIPDMSNPTPPRGLVKVDEPLVPLVPFVETIVMITTEVLV
jgi:hypothetical protein